MSDFVKVIQNKQLAVYKQAKEKGWHEFPRLPLEYHMLIVSEIAEATEEVRLGTKPIHRVGNEYKGELIELADAVIRIMDYCQSQGYDLGYAIELKQEYNKMRPQRHGGKLK